MTIAYSSKGAGLATTSAAGTPLTFSHTAVLGADIFLVIENTSAQTYSAVTFNGAAMASAAAVDHNNSNANGQLKVYYLAGAGTGSPATVSFTPSANTYVQANTFAWTGVGSKSAAVTAFGQSTTPAAAAVTLSAGQVAFGAIAYGYPVAAYGPISSPTGSGATNDHLVNGSLNASGLSVSHSSTSGVVFGATLGNAAAKWSTVTIVLSESGTLVAPGAASVAATGDTPVVTGPPTVIAPTGASATATPGTPAVSQTPVRPGEAAAAATGGTPVVTTSTPVTYLGKGTAQTGTGTAISVPVTAAAGKYALLVIEYGTNPSLSTPQLGGVDMVKLGATVPAGGSAANGNLVFYELYNIAGGSVNATATLGSSVNFNAQVFIFDAVVNSGVATTGGGLASSITTGAVSCSAGALLVGVLGYSSGVGASMTPTGGTNRHLGSAGSTSLNLAVSDSSTSPTTFGATLSTLEYTNYAVLVLSGPIVPVAPGAATVAATTGTPLITQADGGIKVPGAGTLGAAFGTPNVTIFPALPLDLVNAKIEAGQSVKMLFVGDSTIQGSGDVLGQGWPYRVGLYLGEASHTNAQLAGVTVYNAGTSNAINVINGGIGGTCITNGAANGLGLLGGGSWDSTPPVDVMWVTYGINDMSIGGYNTTTFAGEMLSFVQAVRARYSTLPIIVTTCQPTSGGDAYRTGFANMATALTGQSYPFDRPCYPSNVVPGVYVLDTRQAWDDTYQAGFMNDGLHPNSAGYTLYAKWAVAALANVTISLTTMGTPGVARGGTVTPTGATPSATPGTPAAVLSGDVTIQPSGATVAGTLDTPGVDAGGSTVRPAAAGVAATAGTPGIAQGGTDTPSAASVTVTGGTPGIVQGGTDTPGAASAAATPGTPGVSQTGGATPQPEAAAISATLGIPGVTHGGAVTPGGAIGVVTPGTPGVYSQEDITLGAEFPIIAVVIPDMPVLTIVL